MTADEFEADYTEKRMTEKADLIHLFQVGVILPVTDSIHFDSATFGRGITPHRGIQ